MTGEQVENILTSKGVKKVDVAEKLGMTIQNFCAIFRVKDVKSGTLERIAEASGVPLSEFYGIAPFNIANGDGNTQVAGNGNTISSSELEKSLSKALEELAAQRKLTEKAQEQIDRLIGLLERK